MATAKEKARTAWKNKSSTTVSTPRQKTGTEAQRGVFDPNKATDRVEKRASQSTAKPTTPKAKKKPVKPIKKKTDNTATELAKMMASTEATTSVRNPEANTLGVDTLDENAGLTDFYNQIQSTSGPVQPEAVGGYGSIDAPLPGEITEQGVQGGGQQPLQQLPPAEELPPDAPLWLKLIRGVLTPVPPLAMIPHMFIQGMEQKRAAAQAEDSKNMEYFWDMYDRNPIAAAELAKTPLFRDTLQRRHGFTAQDLQDIGEAAKAQPFKSSEMAQMLGQNVVEKGAGQPGISQGDLRLGRVQPPKEISKGSRLYSTEDKEILYNSAQEDIDYFHKIHKEANPKATKLESMMMRQAMTDKRDMVKWMVAGDKLVAYDNTKDFDSMIKDKSYSILNNKNKGKAEITVDKDGLGNVRGLFITNPNVDDASLDEETGDYKYDTSYVDLAEILSERLAREFDGKPEPTPKEADKFLTTTFKNVMKSLSKSIGGDITGNEEIAALVKQVILEEFYARGGKPQEGHGGTGGTTTTVSEDVQAYY